MEIFISKSEQDTINFAKDFAKNLKKGDIVVLSGELGSGKTKFTQGILEFFGVGNEISSPTFTVVNEHHTDDINIYHFDVYRLEDSDEFYAMGGEEYFENGICIIEWGEIIEDILPKNYTKITFSKSSDNTDFRELKIEKINL
jgi:tRNA threonylcarbamoyladenosine biosynthesis protein TsaE